MLCVAVSQNSLWFLRHPAWLCEPLLRSLVRQPPRSFPLRVSSRWAASVLFSGITGFETAVVDMASVYGFVYRFLSYGPYRMVFSPSLLATTGSHATLTVVILGGAQLCAATARSDLSFSVVLVLICCFLIPFRAWQFVDLCGCVGVVPGRDGDILCSRQTRPFRRRIV